MQISLFEKTVEPQIELYELFEAYFACRKNKRNTANALAFEVDYESKLIQLCKEINDGSYKISRSIAFMICDPVEREIFAADFRDRIVHHLIIGKLNPLLRNNSFMIVMPAGWAKEPILGYSEQQSLSDDVLKTTPKIVMY